LLAAGALLPVAAAAQQGDVMVRSVLTQVLSGIGVELIANLIQGWKDKTDEQITHEVLGSIQQDTDLQQALDTLIEKLEVVSSVKQALSDADKQWFAATLQAELKKVGSTINIQTISTGAIHDNRDSNFNFGTGTLVVAQNGSTVIIGEQPVEMSPEMRATALGRYLEHIIAHNRYLQLQGIRSGGKLVNIELEHIYIRLRTTRQRTPLAEQEFLAQEAALAPGERQKHPPLEERPTEVEPAVISVEQALAEHRHLVVLGDPGSGKTTLLRYLALLYARDLADGQEVVKNKLGLSEAGYLPILLPLRKMGQFMAVHHARSDGTEGCALLLKFLLEQLKGQSVELSANFFDHYLKAGRAVILLDGMDEVADPALRARVARLVDDFTLAYSACRFVVTSRIVGYTGAARLGGDYVTTTVREFNLDDIKLFLTHWNRLVAIGQMNPGQSAEAVAASQTEQLLAAIQSNERVRELAINPLMLTVIALVHRDRVKLPDRRAELYAEAVAVLLGKWDEARGVSETAILDDQPFDARERGYLLQQIALHMHEKELKELHVTDLRKLLVEFFSSRTPNQAAAQRAADRFLRVVEERTGLLAARGEGVYAFSHLTFQEYLAALEICGRDDYVETLLSHSAAAWWREVILLSAGSLSPERATKLIRALADLKKEPQPYHNLVLASECLRDASGSANSELQATLQQRLNRNLRTPMPALGRALGKWGGLRGWIDRRAEALQALARSGAGYWSGPYGEPEWITIPAGEFWMGEDDEIHRVYLPEYQIARVPVTNYQYGLFVKATGNKAPHGWEDQRPPRGRESHPVVYVSWYHAIAYCNWLRQMTGKPVTLLNEAEWEKAARGDRDQRAYPWGHKFDRQRCNTTELGLHDTTPVGIFLEGASPYGVLDLSGNVDEWTRSVWGKEFVKPGFTDPYADRFKVREDLLADSDIFRILRGGSWLLDQGFARCACRYWRNPGYGDGSIGFRVSLRAAPERVAQHSEKAAALKS